MLNKELLLAQGKTKATLRVHGTLVWGYNGEDFEAPEAGIYVRYTKNNAGSYDYEYIISRYSTTGAAKEESFEHVVDLPVGSLVFIPCDTNGSLEAYSGGITFVDNDLKPTSPPVLGQYGGGKLIQFIINDDADVEVVARNMYA